MASHGATDIAGAANNEDVHVTGIFGGLQVTVLHQNRVNAGSGQAGPLLLDPLIDPPAPVAITANCGGDLNAITNTASVRTA